MILKNRALFYFSDSLCFFFLRNNWLFHWKINEKEHLLSIFFFAFDCLLFCRTLVCEIISMTLRKCVLFFSHILTSLRDSQLLHWKILLDSSILLICIPSNITRIFLNSFLLSSHTVVIQCLVFNIGETFLA